jgi:hypothetical protein
MLNNRAAAFYSLANRDVEDEHAIAAEFGFGLAMEPFGFDRSQAGDRAAVEAVILAKVTGQVGSQRRGVAPGRRQASGRQQTLLV